MREQGVVELDEAGREKVMRRVASSEAGEKKNKPLAEPQRTQRDQGLVGFAQKKNNR